MDSRSFMARIWRLPMPTQREQVLDALQPAPGQDRLGAALEGGDLSPPCCPGCKAERRYRHGRDRGLQRYRCRACGRTSRR